jgi:tetratricopeptide (TPR) repeat protein
MSLQDAPDSAELLMRQAIDLRRRTEGGQYHRLPLDQMDLARIVQRQGQHDEAEELYRAGLRKMESGTGYTSPERVTAYSNFGDLLRKKGENAAAATYYRKALRLTADTMGKGHPRARRARDHLFTTLIERGRYEQALSVARTNLTVLRRRYSETHPAVPTAYQRVGHLLDNMGRPTQARPLLRRAVRLQHQARGNSHLWTHDARARLALCLVEHGRLIRAEQMLGAAAEVLRRTPADSTTINLRRLEAIVAVGTGRLQAERRNWSEAADHLEEGYRLRRRQAGLRAPLSQRALRALVQVHEATEKPRQAAAYRDSLLAR